MKDINLIKLLYEEYTKTNEHKQRLEDFKEFCEGCLKNLLEIPNKHPGFISDGYNPVAGIGFGTSELTKDCQDKMRKEWQKYAEILEKIKSDVSGTTVSEYSGLVKEARGHTLNLFVNRSLITLHYTEVLAIANLEHLKVLYKLLGKENEFDSNDNQNIKWYNNNKKIFDELAKTLGVKEADFPELSMFGWYLKENLLQSEIMKKTLENCHNVIFTGAPGTGKTYMAKDIAKKMQAKMKFVQFHPSYDYTDFVEGLRPISSSSFSRQNGIFKEFCSNAVKSLLNNEETKYIMIIDEINRGEISKIFGELFFSIDSDYRVKKEKLPKEGAGYKQIDKWEEEDVKDFAIQTQYQNLIDKADDPFRYGFFVPENVYIIGTMNDIDRSVESMDFAMRRRFTFVEFVANEHLGMLDNIMNYDTKKLAEVKMRALNEAIVNSQIGGLTQSYQIGGSYFTHVNDYTDSDDPWEDLWNYHLKGLLFEYFRGIPDAIDKLKSLKEVFKKTTTKK